MFAISLTSNNLKYIVGGSVTFLDS